MSTATTAPPLSIWARARCERGDNAVYKIARATLAMERFEFETGAHPLMVAPTLNVGAALGGLNFNSVPDGRRARHRHPKRGAAASCSSCSPT